MKWHIKAIGIVLVSSLPMTVSAQEAGFYLGGALGYANLDEDSSNLQSDLVNEGLTGTVTVDDEDMGCE